MSYDQNWPSDGILLYGGFSLAHGSLTASSPPPAAVTIVDHRTDKKPVVVELTDHYGVTITPRAADAKPVKSKGQLDSPESNVFSPSLRMAVRAATQRLQDHHARVGGWGIPGWDHNPSPSVSDDEPDVEAWLARKVREKFEGGAASMAVSKTVPPELPVTQRVLFDGCPLPHVVGASEVQGWVDVLVFDDDERPMWDNAKGGWKTERLTGEVKWIKG